MSKEEEKKITYLIVHDDGTERKITVPGNWKVTFGPAVKGFNAKDHGMLRCHMALHFYEAETKQRAIFTDVKSFRDLSIVIEVKKVPRQEKHGYMECDGQRKATTFHAEVNKWINPDEDDQQAVLPSPSQVKQFDVEFSEVD